MPHPKSGEVFTAPNKWKSRDAKRVMEEANVRVGSRRLLKCPSFLGQASNVRRRITVCLILFRMMCLVFRLMCLMCLSVLRFLPVRLCLALSRLRVMDKSLFLKFFHLADVESESVSVNSPPNVDSRLDASEDVKCVFGPKMSSGSWKGWKGWEGRWAGLYEDSAWRTSNATTPARAEGEEGNVWKSFSMSEQIFVGFEVGVHGQTRHIHQKEDGDSVGETSSGLQFCHEGKWYCAITGTTFRFDSAPEGPRHGCAKMGRCAQEDMKFAFTSDRKRFF